MKRIVACFSVLYFISASSQSEKDKEIEILKLKIQLEELKRTNINNNANNDKNKNVKNREDTSSLWPEKKRVPAQEVSARKNEFIQRFLFITYPLSSPKLDVEGYKVEGESASFDEQKIKKSFGIKGQLFRILPTQKESISPAIGIGGNFGFKSKYENNDNGVKMMPMSFHLYLGGNVELENKSSLLPSFGLGLGNVNFDWQYNRTRTDGTTSISIDTRSKIGFSYELGLIYRYNQFSFSLVHQTMNSDINSNASVDGEEIETEGKFVLISTLLNVGFSF